LQTLVFGLQLFGTFAPGRVKGYALHRTDDLALRFGIMPDALGTLVWVNFVNLLAHVNGIVGADWLADITIDAFVGNH
jgi:hypothetical protein